MADMTSQDMAGKLLAAGFERSGPAATALSDPIADTPMVVTLDQLRPYDHDPRMKRNPAYEEIKASIRERGLEALDALARVARLALLFSLVVVCARKSSRRSAREKSSEETARKSERGGRFRPR